VEIFGANERLADERGAHHSIATPNKTALSLSRKRQLPEDEENGGKDYSAQYNEYRRQSQSRERRTELDARRFAKGRVRLHRF
jgi:hypothetical protein